MNLFPFYLDFGKETMQNKVHENIKYSFLEYFKRSMNKKEAVVCILHVKLNYKKNDV